MAEAFNSYSFPPLVEASPTMLILGTMPGIASLQAQQYYAHPRNAFWPIMAIVYGFDVSLSYDERCSQLMQNDVAVWDVLAACHRPGSLDQHIDQKTAQPNDFLSFFKRYRNVKHVCFNGQKAANLFKKHVLPDLDKSCIDMTTLPSTSPAHASLSFEQKLIVWESALRLSPHCRP